MLYGNAGPTPTQLCKRTDFFLRVVYLQPLVLKTLLQCNLDPGNLDPGHCCAPGPRCHTWDTCQQAANMKSVKAPLLLGAADHKPLRVHC